MIAVDCCVKSQDPRWQWYAMMPPFFTPTGGTLIFILSLYVVWVKTVATGGTQIWATLTYSTFQPCSFFWLQHFDPLQHARPNLFAGIVIQNPSSQLAAEHQVTMHPPYNAGIFMQLGVRQMYDSTQCPQCPQCWSNHSDSPGLIIRNWSVTLGLPERRRPQMHPHGTLHRGAPLWDPWEFGASGADGPRLLMDLIYLMVSQTHGALF